MIDPVSDRRIPLPQSMALRVAVLGVGAFVLFAIVFFRLWYLQVLSGDSYLRQSQVNKVRTERIGAPRGKILDRNGATLVENKQATIITLDPTKIADEEKELAVKWGEASAAADDKTAREKRLRLERIQDLRDRGVKLRVARKRNPPVKDTKVAIPPIPTRALKRTYARLGKVIGLKPETIQERLIVGLWQTPYAPVRLKVDVDDDVRDYLLERAEKFPGVEPTQAYVRRYPYKDVAAQIFGTTGQISEDQIKTGEFKDAPQGTVVGQSGLEREYDETLRGRDGVERFLVDAQGERKAQGRATEPAAGRTVKLTIDRKLQLAGQKALKSVAGARPTAFVAMNPDTGSVYALGSAPSFDPNVFSRPITPQRFEELFSAQAGSPLFNRATTGGYPVGSTFKPITSLAALDSGMIDPSTVIASPACVTISDREFCNAGKKPLGNPNLVEALKISADVYFYRIGERFNPRLNIQSWARKLGLGKRTGIDLPGEAKGTIPTPRYRTERAELEDKCREKKNISLKANVFQAAAQGCGISDKRPWSVGDNVQVAIGQGDVQATPLQMATAYSALANGGRVVKPHLGAAVDDELGRQISKIDPPKGRKVKIDSGELGAVRQGLRESTGPGGTSGGVFAGWNQGRFPVWGKTGTAQRPPYPDQSWFVAWSRDTTGKKPPIVIAATVENAGFGADFAAPAVRAMLSSWFGRAATPKGTTTGASGPAAGEGTAAATQGTTTGAAGAEIAP